LISAVFNDGKWEGTPKPGTDVQLRRVEWNGGKFFTLPYELCIGTDGRFLSDVWGEDGTVKHGEPCEGDVHDEGTHGESGCESPEGAEGTGSV
jgi:hypothetical protein